MFITVHLAGHAVIFSYPPLLAEYVTSLVTERGTNQPEHTILEGPLNTVPDEAELAYYVHKQ